MKRHATAAIVGLTAGFCIGAPYSLVVLVLGLALPCFLLWVAIVEGPDPAARDAAEWRGNWQQLLRDAEALRAQNNIRRGPRG
jgi:hypothetical protein